MAKRRILPFAPGDASKPADGCVNPYCVEDLKYRESMARSGGRLNAFDDIYEGYPFSGGLLTGTTLMSQFDGSQFDIATGVVLRGPAKAVLAIDEVRVRSGQIPSAAAAMPKAKAARARTGINWRRDAERLANEAARRQDHLTDRSTQCRLRSFPIRCNSGAMP
ncbi:hypothetical protein QTH97_27740 [Variovorax sp. J22R24]|uniref:Rieske (2Fe-2S) protein n=1 Tax=Variovorax gracilis TaxID=3053502 RepID=UPI002574AD21|nr:hypothetical protein [Variovorax sp. J22R24]MDM0108766.1 hypothetical protein [Variovorax sp. J22R24]